MTSIAGRSAPILPVPVAVDPPGGFWEREASHYPQPLSPLTRSLWIRPVNAIWRQIAADTGMFIDGIAFEEIGGWVYTRVVPLGGKDRKPLPAPLMWLALRTIPFLRRRVRAGVRSIRDDLMLKYIERWHSGGRERQIDAIASLRGIDPFTLDADAAASHLQETIDFWTASVDLHFRLVVPIGALFQLVLACTELLGWEEREALELLVGLSGKSTEPSHRLAALTRMAADRPAVRAFLDRADATNAHRLADIDAEFAAAFAAYQHEFGFRALRYEAADPSLDEVPALTLHLIRDQLVRGYDPAAEDATRLHQRDASRQRARAALTSHSEADRERFERMLSRAERYYPVREENEFFTVSQPTALVRRAALACGRRLAERGQIDDGEDVFFLELAEIAGALRAGTDQHALVTRRRGERTWVLAHPGPPAYGANPPARPPLSIFPEEIAFTIRGVDWATDRIFGGAANRSQAERRRVRGTAASPGRYTGVVRVVHDETEFDKIRAGDVLVCPITSPVWSVVFPSVGALVTDTGGILSHPAIIAREYGIPAVVATGDATETLQDGQTVTVDGRTGEIEVVG